MHTSTSCRQTRKELAVPVPLGQIRLDKGRAGATSVQAGPCQANLEGVRPSGQPLERHVEGALDLPLANGCCAALGEINHVLLANADMACLALEKTADAYVAQFTAAEVRVMILHLLPHLGLAGEHW